MTAFPSKTIFCLSILLIPMTLEAGSDDPRWKKHTVGNGSNPRTAIAADFTGDGLLDVVANMGITRLYIAPDWTPVTLGGGPFIHSEVFDVDDDGDPDYIGSDYSPSVIQWFECPDNPASDPWTIHLVGDQLNGTHGLLKGDVDGDEKFDLIAGSALATGAFPESIAWYRVPENPRTAERWERYVFADQDAPGLGHYFGFGDVNGDFRPDVAHGAKGGPAGSGEWFAWWEAPVDPEGVWTKHLISDQQPGATNIHPANVDNDGEMDFIASRGHGVGVIWFEAPDWTEHTIDPTIREPHCLTVADIDGDGDVDAATTAFGSTTTAWYENNGRGNFTIHILDTNQAAYDIRAIDMEGDGDIDLLVGGQNSGNVVLYEQLSFQLPGDCNQDATIDISDGVCVLNVLFKAEPLPCGDGTPTDPGNISLLDWQPDGGLDLSDAIGLLQFFFLDAAPHPLAVQPQPTELCVEIPGCPANADCHQVSP
jgi:hypothetical protein